MRLQAWAKKSWATFRSETVYFQARVFLIAAYVAVVVATVAVTRWSTRPEPWRVEQKRISFGISFITSLDVTNVDAGDQRGASIEVDGQALEFDGRKTPGTWRTVPMDIAEDATIPINSQQLFEVRKNTNPPSSFFADTVRVVDKDGEVLAEIHPKAADGSVKE